MNLLDRLEELHPGRGGPILLVDGNNIMGQRPGWWRDKPRAQQALLEKIVEYAGEEALRLVLFFDGRPPPGLPREGIHEGIGVSFAPKGVTADDRMADMVYRNRRVRDLVVVTSDKRLRRRAEVLGAEVASAGGFRARMEERVGKPDFP